MPSLSPSVVRTFSSNAASVTASLEYEPRSRLAPVTETTQRHRFRKERDIGRGSSAISMGPDVAAVVGRGGRAPRRQGVASSADYHTGTVMTIGGWMPEFPVVGTTHMVVPERKHVVGQLTSLDFAHLWVQRVLRLQKWRCHCHGQMACRPCRLSRTRDRKMPAYACGAFRVEPAVVAAMFLSSMPSRGAHEMICSRRRAFGMVSRGEGLTRCRPGSVMRTLARARSWSRQAITPTEPLDSLRRALESRRRKSVLRSAALSACYGSC